MVNNKIRHIISLAGCMVLLAVGVSCQKEVDNPDLSPWTEIPDTTAPVTDTTTPPTTDTIPADPDTAAIYVLPKECSMWNGHFVALVDSISPREAYLVLMSLRDWSKMTSASNATTPTQSIDTAASYSEGTTTSWQIPTEEQARRLKTLYSEGTAYHSQANALLRTAGADTLSLLTGSAKSRYLCQEATKTFSFCSGTNVTNAGATIKNYHLRLVSRVSLTR